MNGKTRLSEADLRFLVETVADQRQDHDFVMALVRDKEDFLEQMLEDPELVHRILNDDEALVRISPWMLFSILLRQATRDLAKQSYINEVGDHGELIPIFGVGQVASLLGQKCSRDYLVEMMSSFAKTRSTVVYWLEKGRLRRRRFSDMDMDDMMQLCHHVEAEERPKYYQRIADIALFLSGIFPEQARGSHRHLGGRPRWRRTLEDYEREGQIFYGLAARESSDAELGPVFRTLSEKFSSARRALNFLSERYIRSQRAHYFGLS